MSVLVVAVVAAGCAAPAASVSQSPPEPTASTPSSSPSAEPSEEPSAEPSRNGNAAALVLQLSGPGEAGPVHLVTILDDGRVITSDPLRVNPPTERRLTPAGIQLVRDEVAATGHTDASASYAPVANPGKELGFGGSGSVLEIGQPGRDAILISWYLFADTDQDLAAPQPEAEALEALAGRLTTLEEWLPADAWADASAGPFEPERYLMAIDPQPRVPGDTEWVDVAAVSWPLEDGIDAFGEVSDPPIDDVRTGCLDGADGRAVMDALDAAGASIGDESELVRTFTLGDGPSSQVVIALSPILTSTTSCEVD